MSSEYGFLADLKLQGWESDVKAAFRAIEEGDVNRAITLANEIERSCTKYNKGTRRRNLALIIASLV